MSISRTTYTDARYTVWWLEFQHAATTGDWSGAVCDERSAVTPPQQGVSDRERSFSMTASYQRGDRRGDVRSRGDRDRGPA